MSALETAAPALASADPVTTPVGRRLSLLALALGTFCIGTTEFASMGMIQLFSGELGIDIPTATHAITTSELTYRRRAGLGSRSPQ